MGNRVQPADWKRDAVKNGLAYYRAKFKASPHPLLAATLAPAAAETVSPIELDRRREPALRDE